jgi:hypothetical protein
MPIKSCKTQSGGNGFKFGDSGHCYPTREEALKQMRAIKFEESHGNAIDYSGEGLTNEELLILGIETSISMSGGY